MNVIRTCLAAAAFSLPAAAFAQAAAPAPPSGAAAEALTAYTRLKPNILKAADKMPAESYAYKPTPDIRTFARVVNHITEAQFRVCSAMNGGSFDPKAVPAETADKDAVVAALKASFAECDKAYGALTDTTLTSSVSLGPMGKRSQIGAAWGNISHDNEQYATLSLYLRLKGLVPPTSEK